MAGLVYSRNRIECNESSFTQWYTTGLIDKDYDNGVSYFCRWCSCKCITTYSSAAAVSTQMVIKHNISWHLAQIQDRSESADTKELCSFHSPSFWDWADVEEAAAAI